MTAYHSDPAPPYAYLIERATGRDIVRLLADLKELRAQGWDVTALLCPDGSVIGMGVGERYCERVEQLSLLGEASA